MESLFLVNSEITNRKKKQWNDVFCVCVLWERVVGCVVEAGVQKHGQGAECGDDDKQPEEESVHHQGDELPVSCHLRTHTHTLCKPAGAYLDIFIGGAKVGHWLMVGYYD